LSVVRSSFTSFVAKRRDGVIGRNDLIGIVFFAPSFYFRASFVTSKFVRAGSQFRKPTGG
jgi:hypothetical protein